MGFLDALLGRSFKSSKFNTLVNQAISRLSVLKNQKRARCSIARSDVVQLLQISEHERALIRVEQVIKEQNILDVFAMIEGYLILLSERAKLIKQEKTCPEELQEAISSLIFAASRCGDLPELQKIRYVFGSRYGKEFTLRATELRNRCGVSLRIIQKLSTQQPSLESRLKLLKDIADDNGISLKLEEAPSMAARAEENKKEDNRCAKNLSAGSKANFGDDLKRYAEELSRVEDFRLSVNTGKRYKDVGEAAQEAFLAAAYAAAAARAAVELSRSSSGGPPLDLTHPNNNTQRKKVLDSNSEVKSRNVNSQKKKLRELEDSDLWHAEVHPLNHYILNSSEEEICQSDKMVNIKQVDPKSISSGIAEQNLKFKETLNEDDWEERETKLIYCSPKQTASNKQANSGKDSDEQISSGLAVKSSQRPNTVNRPFSVRTRR